MVTPRQRPPCSAIRRFDGPEETTAPTVTTDNNGNLSDARTRLAAAAPHSHAANEALADIEHLGAQIRRGELATYPGDLRCALSLGGLADLTYRDESVDDVRVALRAYGQWLIQVAALWLVLAGIGQPTANGG
jgi:hypothetical protein